MKVIGFFSGAGGLDLGFEKSGFEIPWANEFDSTIWETYEKNHKNTYLEKRDLRKISMDEIPCADGIIGGPPCQSWSEAGRGKGVEDKRGQLFFDYINVISNKQPLFFLAENVSGILAKRHEESVKNIVNSFENAGEIGYNVNYKLLNSSDYGVPQDRKRVFFIGFRKDLSTTFDFDKFIEKYKIEVKKDLREAIGDLEKNVVPALEKNYTSLECKIDNHEYMIGGFSSMFMSRNRVRKWDEQSFTIQAGGRHAPIHPQAPVMTFVSANKRIFEKGNEHLYRRLSVRECARIQTFPDDFKFYYTKVADGYKMVGNAVPVELAYLLGKEIRLQLKK